MLKISNIKNLFASAALTVGCLGLVGTLERLPVAINAFQATSEFAASYPKSNTAISNFVIETSDAPLKKARRETQEICEAAIREGRAEKKNGICIMHAFRDLSAILVTTTKSVVDFTYASYGANIGSTAAYVFPERFDRQRASETRTYMH